MRKRPQFDRWKPLADYNAEVARGIVHTPEYDAKMADWQRMFDAEMAERYGGKPRYLPEKPNPAMAVAYRTIAAELRACAALIDGKVCD